MHFKCKTLDGKAYKHVLNLNLHLSGFIRAKSDEFDDEKLLQNLASLTLLNFNYFITVIVP